MESVAKHATTDLKRQYCRDLCADVTFNNFIPERVVIKKTFSTVFEVFMQVRSEYGVGSTNVLKHFETGDIIHDGNPNAPTQGAKAVNKPVSLVPQQKARIAELQEEMTELREQQKAHADAQQYKEASDLTPQLFKLDAEHERECVKLQELIEQEKTILENQNVRSVTLERQPSRRVPSEQSSVGTQELCDVMNTCVVQMQHNTVAVENTGAESAMHLEELKFAINNQTEVMKELSMQMKSLHTENQQLIKMCSNRGAVNPRQGPKIRSASSLSSKRREPGFVRAKTTPTSKKSRAEGEKPETEVPPTVADPAEKLVHSEDEKAAEETKDDEIVITPDEEIEAEEDENKTGAENKGEVSKKP